MDVETGFIARPAQYELHESLKRFNVVVAHRRFGKTVWAVNETIDRALQNTKPSPRYAYVAPTYSQAKRVVWDYVQQYTANFPGVTTNQAELRADFLGRRISLFGADNPDSLKGIYLDGVVLDEFAQIRPRVWSEVLRPTLVDRQGWAIFIGTPMGRNEFWRLFDGAQNGFMGEDGVRQMKDDTWAAKLFRAADTGVVPEAELAAARAAMTPEQFAQEFECSFEAAIIGAYYGKLMAEAETAGRITDVPYDSGSLVTTAWDFGIDDSTAIWFVQRVALQWRVLDYYEASSQPLAHYAALLKSKPYHYGAHILPHDAGQRRLGRDHLHTVAQMLTDLEVKPNSTLPASQVEGGIEEARRLIPKCWFDRQRCAKGLEALRHYRREWDEELKTFKPRPLHDWSSHGADAFRYLATRQKTPAEKPKTVMAPRYNSGGTGWMG